MNPILVSMKVPPHVVLATYGVSAFYSVTIAIMQYFIFGTVPLAYAFLFFICGIAGALCGVFLLHFLNSQKAIVWSMVLLFLVSIIAVFMSFVLELRGLQVLQEIWWNVCVFSSWIQTYFNRYLFLCVVIFWIFQTNSRVDLFGVDVFKKRWAQ